MQPPTAASDSTPHRFALSLLQLWLVWGLNSLALKAAEPIRYENSTTFADCVVTFNELSYNPAPLSPSDEWIELHNQLAVMVDLSGWTIDGAGYTFPKGTYLPGGAYLVVAVDPADFEKRHGFKPLGPLPGRLSAGGERLILRNHNGRLMDELRYADDAPWPLLPDGSGATLAKRIDDSPSSAPRNWRASAQLGGTPGKVNFPIQAPSTPPPVETLLGDLATARWKVPTAADADLPWYLPNVFDSAWNLGTNGFGFDRTTGRSWPEVSHYYPFENAATDATGHGPTAVLQYDPQYATVPSPDVGSTASLRLDGIDDFVEIMDPGPKPAYTLGLWIRFNQVRAGSLMVLTDWSGPSVSWSHQLRVTADGHFEHYTFDGEWNVVTGSTTIQPNRWYHVVATAEDQGFARLFVDGHEEGEAQALGTMWRDGVRWLLGSDSSGFPALLDGWIDDVAIWDQALSPSDIAILASGVSPMGGQAFRSRVKTDLESALYNKQSSAWFRYPFEAPAVVGYDSLTLQVRYNDGLVVWLNGIEVARRNTPAVTDWQSHAVNPRSTPESMALETIDLSVHASKLKSSGNILAVQLLTAGTSDENALLEVGLKAQQRDPLNTTPAQLVISEVTPGNAADFWIELYNAQSSPIHLGDFILRSSSGSLARLPNEFLPPATFRVFHAADLPLVVGASDRLFLLGAQGTVPTDAVRLQVHPQARSTWTPAERFLRPSNPTPGGPNAFRPVPGIVINEILYHAPPTYARPATTNAPAIPFAENPEQWIELYNPSDTAIDLSGWRLEDDIRFVFPTNSILNADEYLIVTGNASVLKGQYPGVRILGDWQGSLSGRSGHIELWDADGNPVDEVRYFEDAPWPGRADGGGSSLELRNPTSNHSLPESWAASDESARTSWKEYRVRARAISPTKGPAINGFHEFRMGLLADGEALVDDVRVIEDPDGTARNLIQNSGFDGARAWRFLGNHSHSRVVAPTDSPTESVLNLVATDARGYMNNQIETTLKVGGTVVPIVTGRTYEIALRARWIGGSPQLHTELYYNKVAATIILDQPTQHGTPGRRNSTYTPNLGPQFDSLAHSPLIPKAGEKVLVSVHAVDPDGISSIQLYTSINGGAWQQTPMTTGADHVFSTTLTSPSNLGVVQFYVEATDTLGNTSVYPAGGPRSRALFRSDSRPAKPLRKRLAFILTPADGRLLDSTTNMMSDDRLGATVIWNDSEVFYDCGVHLHGSMFTRQGIDSVPYNIKFPADHRFRGVHNTIQPNRGVIEEIIAKHTQNQAGIPGMYEDIVELQSHRTANAGAARLSMAHYNDIFLGSQFEDGTRGMLYNMEGIRVLEATHNGSAEGIKLGMPVGWVGDYDIMNLGDDPEQYRFSTTLRNNRANNDFRPYIAMAKAFSLTAASFEKVAPTVIDVDEWMRYYALLTLFEIGDTYTFGNPHNIGFYARPSDGKILALPYDWDFFFANGDTSVLVGNQNLAKLVNRPANTRVFYGHLLDLIEGAYTTTNLTPFITNFGTVAGQSFTTYTSRIRARSNYVRTRLPARIPFEITSNGGADIATDVPSIQLEGRGWVDVRDVRHAEFGRLQLTWLDASRWLAIIPLPSSTNAIQLEALNRRGEVVGSDSIVISTTHPEAEQRTALRLSEIHYHPAAPSISEADAGFTNSDDFEFLEISNYADQPLDLSGVRISGSVVFAFPNPGGPTLPSKGAAVLVRRPQAFARRYPNATPPAGAYTGALSNGGGSIQLWDRFGLLIHTVDYDDRPPWPTAADGDGASLELISPEGPISIAAGWRLGRQGGSPGTIPSNIAAPLLVSGVTPQGAFRIQFVAQRGTAYRIESASAPEAQNWQEEKVFQPVDADQTLAFETPPTEAARFYRVVAP